MLFCIYMAIANLIIYLAYKFKDDWNVTSDLNDVYVIFGKGVGICNDEDEEE